MAVYAAYECECLDESEIVYDFDDDYKTGRSFW